MKHIRLHFQSWWGIVYWLGLYSYMGPPLPHKIDYMAHPLYWSLPDNVRLTIAFSFMFFVGWPYVLGGILAMPILSLAPDKWSTGLFVLFQFIFGGACSICIWRFLIKNFHLRRKPPRKKQNEELP